MFAVVAVFKLSRFVTWPIRCEQVLQESMKKKELKPVDHSKIAYIDIRKNLYIIPKSLASASEEKASAPLACGTSLAFLYYQ